MRRTVAFYVSRVNSLRVLAPLIDYLRRSRSQEFRAMILFPGWRISKSELQPTARDFTSPFGEDVELRCLADPSEFIRLISTGTIDAVVNHLTQVPDIDRQTVQRLRAESRAVGTKWIALPYVFAQSEFVADDPGTAADLWDVICVEGPPSLHYIESHLNGVSPDTARALKARIVITGYPELDGIRHLPDEQSIRRKYGLPDDRPVVFLGTAPRFYPLVNHSLPAHGLEMRFRGKRDFSPRGIAAMIASCRYPEQVPYRRYLSAFRHFADANNACLVAKTRPKHHDPAYLTDYVDYVFGDDSFFPLTTLELLRVASLYIGFYSSAALEAVAMGVYAMTWLFLPVAVAEPSPTRQRWLEFFFRGQGKLWNAPGVSAIFDGTARSGDAALDCFANSRLDAYVVDDQRRRALLAQFVSYLGNSSERVVEALAACWS